MTEVQSELARLRAELAVLLAANVEAVAEGIRRMTCHHAEGEMLIYVEEAQRQAARCTGPKPVRTTRTKTENSRKMREAV